MYERLLRWAFARFYREFAWTYDAVAFLVSGGLWRTWALAVLPYLNGTVLELGCGTGYLQQALAQRSSAAFAVGYDISRQMLAHTRRRLARDGHSGNLLRGSAWALPFRAASFDTIVATFPSDYILAPITLQEARRVLRPHGRILIVPAAQFTTDGPYQRLIDLAYRITLQRSPRFVPTPRSPTTVSHLSEQPGLTNERPVASALQYCMLRAGFDTQELIVQAPHSEVSILMGEVAGGPNC